MASVAAVASATCALWALPASAATAQHRDWFPHFTTTTVTATPSQAHGHPGRGVLHVTAVYSGDPNNLTSTGTETLTVS